MTKEGEGGGGRDKEGVCDRGGDGCNTIMGMIHFIIKNTPEIRISDTL